jgi:hypothetical protein
MKRVGRADPSVKMKISHLGPIFLFSINAKQLFLSSQQSGDTVRFPI